MKARISEIQDELLSLIRDIHVPRDDRPEEDVSLKSRDANITDLAQVVAALQEEITQEQQRFLKLEEGKRLEKR